MKLFLIFSIGLIFSTSVSAELLGMVLGRSARVQSHAKVSVELGASWYTNQLQWQALRANIKPSQNLTLFVDYANLQATKLPINATIQEEFNGYGIGAGLLFGVPDFLDTFDFAFKGAFHTSTVNSAASPNSQSYSELELHQSQLNADFLFSPIDPIFENGLSWYGSVGYVSTNAQAQFIEAPLSELTRIRYQDKSGWAFGLGLVKPYKRYSMYAGIEWLSSDPLFGAGVRYALFL